MNIKDKIKKLLALSSSPNDNEAKAALLKAKKLMMDNKLTEDDIDENKTELVHMHMPNIKWTTDSGDVWMNDLCNIISENYLCTIAWCTPPSSRTHTLYLTGLKDDAEVCSKIIEFAVGVINDNIKKQVRRYKNINSRTVRHSYAIGFISGLKTAFDEQREEHVEWGLVEVKPKQVSEYEESLKSRSVRTRESGDFSNNAYANGLNDGMKFNARRVLE